MTQRHPLYPKLEFPAYKHKPFPKVVRDAAGKRLGVAQDKDEEAAIRAAEVERLAAEPPPAPVVPEPEMRPLTADEIAAFPPAMQAHALLMRVPVGAVLPTASPGPAAAQNANDADEKAQLLALAEQAGVTVDKRWGLDKLRGAIDAATAPRAAE